MEGIAQLVWGAKSGFTGVLTTARDTGVLTLAMLIGLPLAEATTVSTIPSGFVRASVSAAPSPREHSVSLVAAPLLQAPVFSGRIEPDRALMGSASLRQPRANWTADSFAQPGRPHAVFVTSGAFAGFVFRVTGNTSDGVSVDALGFDLNAILEPGDSFEIRPLNTFNSLFGSGSASVPFAQSENGNAADQILVSRDGTWRAYWFTGTSWRRTGSAGDAGDDVILPQDGIVVYHRATDNGVALRFTGEAPSGDAVLSIPAGEVSSVANPFPVDARIDQFGFELVQGWRSSADPDQADQIQLRSGDTWRAFFHDGATWRDADTLSTANNESIPAGSSMLVLRQDGDSENPFALILRPYDI